MKLMIFDGNSIINRAFYGVRTLTNSQGMHTNAIYGFLNIFFKFVNEESPDYLCVAFDVKAPTFRHKAYEKYKEQRKPMPIELSEQLPVLKEVLTAMNVAMFEKSGYEADDIIGTVARLCEIKDLECIVVSGDKDDLQLISDKTNVRLITTKMGFTDAKKMDKESLMQEYGLTPVQMIDYKALMGDPSDNIPGVAGIGEKTALELIKKYKSIENIYENIDALDEKESIRKKLADGRDMAYKSRFLGAIFTHVPMELDLSYVSRRDFDRAALYPILKRLEFKSLIEKYNLEIQQPKTNEPAFCDVCSMDDVKDGISIIKKAGELYYILTNEGIAFSLGDKVYTIPSTDKRYTEFLKTIFEDAAIKKYGHNIKDDIVYLTNTGIYPVMFAFDAMIGAYLLQPSSTDYSMEALCERYLNIELPLTLESSLDSAAKRAVHIPALFEKMSAEIEENGQHRLLYQIELPLCGVLASMQIYGFSVDTAALEILGREIEIQADQCQKTVYELSGEKFNINSPKQLGVVLFEKLNLPIIKKTKTGYSTDIDVLQKLRPYSEAIDYIIKYRHLAKLKSTYVDGLISVVDKATGRIHSSFNQTITITGRISSTEPNLQNIPIRTEIGREVRRVFVAAEGYTLIDADYSQIELRVLADIADDTVMIEAFKNGVDIHTLTASSAFKIPLEDVTPLMRSQAKAINFGIVYGIGDFSLSDDLKISRKEARRYIDNYFSTYAGVKEYMDRIVEDAKEKGYVTTLLGRRRYLPELKSSNHNVREFGRRCAMNTPIQGTAADIIKIAMVNVYNRLKAEGLRSRLILQVHDELIIEAFIGEQDRVRTILKEEMENAYPMKVALDVDVHEGKTWYDAKG